MQSEEVRESQRKFGKVKGGRGWQGNRRTLEKVRYSWRKLGKVTGSKGRSRKLDKVCESHGGARGSSRKFGEV